MRSIEPNSRASAWAAVGPTCRMDSATSTRHSGATWPPRRLSSRLLAVGREHACLSGLVLGRTGEQLDPRQGVGVEGEQVALVGETPASSRAAAGLVARAPRCRTRRGRPGGTAARAAAPGRTGCWGSGCRRRPPSAGASSVPHAGQWVGMTNARSVPSRRSTTGPRISGMTSPALRSTTVSPISTPLRSTSVALCRVAISTVDPATLTGSITPNGVTRPVRPTLTWMSSSLVLTSSGGYLNAIAQRGARLVEPSRRCTATSSTLTTTPSISCSTSCRCSP